MKENRVDYSFPAHINDKGEIQSCKEHSFGTAIRTQKNLEPISLGAVGFLAGLLHDCGKYTVEFREYIERASRGEKVRKGSVIHSFTGLSYMLNRYHSEDLDFPDVAAEMIASAIGCHHGLFDCIDEYGKSGFQYRIDKHPRYDETALLNFFSTCCSEDDLCSITSAAVSDLSEVLKACYELNENDDYDEETAFYFGLLLRMITSSLIDGDRSDTSCFMNGYELANDSCKFDWDKCLQNIKEYLDQFQADTAIQMIRKKISNACEAAAALKPGAYILDIPTGGGKTLSGLRYAVAHAKIHQKDRIIYVAPLLSILDQNAEVIRKAVQNDSAILEHHSNIIKEDFEQDTLQRYELLTETWNSPIIISTLVQFLNSLFGGQTTQVRRFHALCNSVIILDEVQTVPNRMLSMFSLTINFLTEICKSTVVLCSATQPPFDADLLSHSLLKKPKQLLSSEIQSQYYTIFRRTELIDKGSCQLKEIPSFVLELIMHYNSVLVVCNKKSEARALYEHLASENNGCQCFHLSAAMCMAHRQKELKRLYEVLASKNKVICVSTQVIEAGVDISFNTVVRFSAGLDNLIQSAGRCNRDHENDVSPVYIVNCSDERLKGLEDIMSSQNAMNELLAAYERNPEQFDGGLQGKHAIQYYYHALYHSFKQGYTDYMTEEGETLLDLLSENNSCLSRGEGHNFLMTQAFKTAGKLFEVFDTRQITVIVPFEAGAALIEQLATADAKDFQNMKSILSQLKPYTVPVYDYELKILYDLDAIDYYCDGKVAVLNEAYYSDKFGVNISKGVEKECSILIL